MGYPVKELLLLNAWKNRIFSSMYPHRLFLPQVLISGGYALRRVRLFHRYNFRFLLLCIPGLLNPGLYPVFRLHPVFHLYLVFHLHPVSLSRLPRHLLFLVYLRFHFLMLPHPPDLLHTGSTKA